MIHSAMRLLLLFGLFLVVCSACEEESLAPPVIDFHYDYFPLAIGREWVYEVDSLRPVATVQGVVLDSLRLQARERLIDTFTDATGQLWYRGVREERASDSLAWQERTTFLLGRSVERAFRVENNLPFAKLVFPPKQGDVWDGNAAFDASQEVDIRGNAVRLFEGWNYEYLQVHAPALADDLPADSTLQVRTVDVDNLLNRRYVEERYAKGIGLIYREWEIFDTQCVVCCGGAENTAECAQLPWREKAEVGFWVRQRLIDFR